MNFQDCYSLTKETLENRWNEFSSLEDSNVKNVNVGIHLFTKLTVQEVEKSSYSQSLSTQDKINNFIIKYFDSFKKVCETNFPFSEVDSVVCEAALKGHFLYPDRPFLIHFMVSRSSTWIPELTLNTYFTKTLKHLTNKEIKEACYDFSFSYCKLNDLRAGYYLLWLIKESTESRFSISEKDIFNSQTVKNTLSSLIENQGEDVKFSTLFIEILLFKDHHSNPPLFQLLLETDNQNQFIDFTINQLQEINEDSWPHKKTVIADLLKIATQENIFIMAKTLSSCIENEMDVIGHHLSYALLSSSLNSAIPHFNALIELLPDLDNKDFETIFLTTFQKFKYNDRKTVNFTRRLKFIDAKKFFTHNNLMIGVCENQRAFSDEFSTSLLAYDSKTEKMKWGIPLNSLKKKSGNFKLNQIDDTITLQFEKDDKVFFIQSDIGEIISTLTTPLVHNDSSDALHITSNNLFCYQMARVQNQRILVGGKISNSKFMTSFNVITPSGLFIPLSTHVGFHTHYIGSQGNFKRTLTIFGPSGASIKIKNCYSVSKTLSGNKLYLIEKNPDNNDSCLLTVRTLTDDENVVSEVEKCIVLNTESPYLLKLCDNGEWILFSEYSSKRFSIFVNIDTEEVVYSSHIIGLTETIINTASGEIWNWDPQTKKIWKTSSKESILMGSLQSGNATTTLLHVDENDCLYYLDSRF